MAEAMKWATYAKRAYLVGVVVGVAMLANAIEIWVLAPTYRSSWINVALSATGLALWGFCTWRFFAACKRLRAYRNNSAPR